MNFLLEKRNIILVSFAAFCVFFFFLNITLRTNIHGDAKFHTLFAKESVETGKLARFNPYWIYDFNGGNRTYVPIAYPLTSESLFSVFYLIGSDVALKMYAPFMAAIIFLLIYLCLSELAVIQAILISFVATLAISERLVMTPLIEPLLTLVLLASIFSLKRYFISFEQKYLYLAGLFLGAAGAIKQQGLFAMITIILIFCTLFILQYVIKKGSFFKTKRVFSVFLFIVLIVPSIALVDQIQRNGTIAFAPGSTKLPNWLPFRNSIQPLVDSKFPSKPSALQARNDRIGYNREKRDLVATLKSFILSPFLFYRSVNSSWITSAFQGIFILFIIMLAFSFISKQGILKKNIIFWTIVVMLLLEEIFASYILTTPVYQYHTFGIILITILFFLALIRSENNSKISQYISITFLFVIFVFGYTSYIFPNITSNGREDSYHLEGYKRIGEFVNTNIPKDAVFLSAETSFRYYAKRDTVWMDESVGDTVNKIISSTKPEEILENLSLLHINYIMIDKSQTQRYGVNDYLPPDGLVAVIDNSVEFTNIFDPYKDGEMVVYKINYNL